MTGGTGPGIIAGGGTRTGATSKRPPGQLLRKKNRKQREKNRIVRMRRRPNTTAPPPRAGTTVVAGLPKGLSRNGQTTRTASRDIINRVLMDTVQESTPEKPGFFLFSLVQIITVRQTGFSSTAGSGIFTGNAGTGMGDCCDIK